MRILQICSTFYGSGYGIGGIETHIREVAQRLVMRGSEVEILTTDPTGNYPKEDVVRGIRVRRVRSWGNEGYFLPAPSLAAAVSKTDADILHVHGYYSLVTPSALISKARDRKSVITLHSGGTSSMVRKALRYPYHMMMRRLTRRVDRIICVSRFEFGHFTRLLNSPATKLEVIPNGVDLEKLATIAATRKETPPILLALGRLEKYKGQHRVVKAFRTFRELFPDIGLRLFVLGQGPYKEHLSTEIKRLGIEQHVRMIDWLPYEQYASLLKASSIVALLSDYESQAIGIAEAICAGSQVMVSMNSSLREYVSNGRAIGVQDPDNSHEVARTMMQMLSDPVQYRSQGYRPPTWEETTLRLEAVYQDILNS